MRSTLESGQKVEFAAWPHFGNEEIEAVSAVLASGKVNYWTGEYGKQFEALFAEFVGSRRAMTISNGTVSLEIAMKAMGIGPGDEVIVTARSFMASASTINWLGATPVFSDVSLQSGNITVETIQPLVNERTKAIIVVHLAGWPCDMAPIMTLARTHGLKVIEDCAQAHGASYHGAPVGGIGDIGSWSFCQDKIISTGGEGGMLAMDDDALWSACWSLRDHGKSYAAVHRTDHPEGYRWLHESIGTNARMTEMQSVLGIIALRNLPSTLKARTRNAEQLLNGLSNIAAIRLERPEEGLVHAYYKFYAYVRPEMLRPDWSRDRILAEIGRSGVPCMSGSCSELYREIAFFRAGLQPSTRLPNAKELGETSMMFLVHPTLSHLAIDRTIEAVTEVFRQAAA